MEQRLSRPCRLSEVCWPGVSGPRCSQVMEQTALAAGAASGQRTVGGLQTEASWGSLGGHGGLLLPPGGDDLHSSSRG